MGRLQERAVAAHGDGEVGGERSIGNQSVGTDVEPALMGEVMVELLLDKYLSLPAGKERQDLGDGGRLGRLVDIAENGEP